MKKLVLFNGTKVFVQKNTNNIISFAWTNAANKATFFEDFHGDKSIYKWVMARYFPPSQSSIDIHFYFDGLYFTLNVSLTIKDVWSHYSRAQDHSTSSKGGGPYVPLIKAGIRTHTVKKSLTKQRPLSTTKLKSNFIKRNIFNHFSQLVWKEAFSLLLRNLWWKKVPIIWQGWVFVAKVFLLL